METTQGMPDPVAVPVSVDVGVGANSGAGDIVPVQVQTQPNQTQEPGVEETKKVETEKEYPVFHCGIRNTGNTCFMNAPLQILARVRRFAQWFRMRGYLTTEGWSSRPKHVVDMCEQFQDMMDALRSPGTNAVTPNGFRGVFVESAVAENMGWMIQGQNDAQEFTSMILNILHKGGSQNVLSYSQVRNAVERKYPDVMTSSTPDVRKVLDDMAETDWWNHYGKEAHPIMTDMFHGQLLTIISSRETDERSFRFEPFMTLDIAVPEFDSGCITLKDCLDSHFANEPMRDDSRWNSPSKGKVNAIRASRIWKLPDVLIMSIKRCSNTGQKINTKVDYSLESLDMSSYCTGPAKESGDATKYILTGVVIHVGVMFGGHYYTYVRNPGGQWMVINDLRVGLLKPEQVIDGVGAYMLVYQRESIVRQDDADDVSWYEKWKIERREQKAKRLQEHEMEMAKKREMMIQERNIMNDKASSGGGAQTRVQQMEDMVNDAIEMTDISGGRDKVVRIDPSAIIPSAEAMETYRRMCALEMYGNEHSLDYSHFTPISELATEGAEDEADADTDLVAEDDTIGLYDKYYDIGDNTLDNYFPFKEGSLLRDDVINRDDTQTINDVTMADITKISQIKKIQK